MSKKFSIDVGGLDIAKKQLDGIQQIENQKLANLGDEVYAFARAVAENGFNNALYAGDNDVEVGGFIRHRTKMEVNFTIWARGYSVLFIEFGTGIFQAEHELADEFDMHHGTYGKGRGSDPKGWVYVGKQGTTGVPISRRHDDVFWTNGDPANEIMYNAWRSIQNGVDARVRRWSHD